MATRAYEVQQRSDAPSEQSSRPLRNIARTRCYLCDSEGALLYTCVSDRHWNVSGTWNLRRCTNRECQLVWLDPAPIPEDIPLMYSEYFTHDGLLQGTAENLRNRLLPFVCRGKSASRRSISQLLLWMLARTSAFRDFTAGALMWLQDAPCGNMLDFGFGAGQLVMRLRDLGWNVAGVEFDHKVLTTAREKLNLDVRSSVLNFPANRFDVITLSHVIEHVPDPINTLRECASRLKPGGRLVVATPNTKSLGHQHFGQNWRPLDPPRHLFLFSSKSLSSCAGRAGLEIEAVSTSARSACFSWYSSKLLKAKNRHSNSEKRSQAGLFLKMSGALFQLWEHYFANEQAGEEVVLIARKPMAAGVASK